MEMLWRAVGFCWGLASIFSLLASSPIWAREASCLRTHQRVGPFLRLLLCASRVHFSQYPSNGELACRLAHFRSNGHCTVMRDKWSDCKKMSVNTRPAKEHGGPGANIIKLYLRNIDNNCPHTYTHAHTPQ